MKILKILLLVIFSLFCNSIYADNVFSLNVPNEYGVCQFPSCGILASEEWQCEIVSYSQAYGTGGDQSRHIVWNGITGSSVSQPIHFEFMHCRMPWENMISSQAYMMKFLERYSKNLSNSGFPYFSDSMSNLFKFYTEGENYMITRMFGNDRWFGVCEICLLWDEKDTYIMISCINLRKDRAEQEQLFEKVRSLIISLDN